MNVQCSCCERRADVAWKRVPVCGDHGLEIARRVAPRPLRDVSGEEIARLITEIGQQPHGSKETASS
jgi:hypothetical protein